MVEKSSQPSELDADYRNADPGFRAGDSSFTVAYQVPMMYQPAKHTFHYPAVRQHFKSAHIVGTFDYFDRQLGTGELCTSITTIDSQQAKPGKPRQHPKQDRLGAVTFGGVGRRCHYPENQTQRATVPFGGFVQHRFEIFPLLVGEIRSVCGVFHRINGWLPPKNGQT